MENVLNRAHGLQPGQIKRVEPGAPLRWLSRGWSDMQKTPLTSIAYGLVFAVLGYLLVSALADLPWIAAALMTGFLIVGPFLAIGLYQLSRRIEEAGDASPRDALTAWRHHGWSTVSFGIFLLLAMVIWLQVSMWITALAYHGMSPNLTAIYTEASISVETFVFLAAFVVVGGLIAALVYVASVVTLPMLHDRDTDLLSSVATSLAAVRTNPKPLILWAVLIVVLTAVGMLLVFVGLAVTMPLVGHASWHAYRDLVA